MEELPRDKAAETSISLAVAAATAVTASDSNIIPRKFSSGALDGVINDTIVEGWAWDERSTSTPVQVALHVDGERVAQIAPQNFRADLAAAGIGHGCFAFSWRIPSELHDGQDHELRAFNVDLEEELPGSPISFCLANSITEVGQVATLFSNSKFDIWPSGLFGELKGRNIEIAPNLVISFGDVEGELSYWVTAPQHAALKGAAYYGLQIATEVDRQCWLYTRLSEGARSLLSAGVTLSVELALGTARESLFTRKVTISLVRKVKGEYERIREIVRGRIFRRPTLLTFMLKVSIEEAKVLAAKALYLGISVDSASDFSAYPPQLVRVHNSPATGFVGFEDQRLVGAFAACRELAQASGRAQEFDRLLLTGLPRENALTNSAQGHQQDKAHSATVISNMSYPFTQIVVPAYNGDAIVVECLRSIQKSTHTPFQCLVINDGSRTLTSVMLKDFIVNDLRFAVFDRAANRGYTKSVNEAIKLTGSDWIVVLNSDTIVSDNWLARLHDAACSRPRVGMVGPLSNAASYQSVPALREADGSWSKNDFIKPQHVDLLQEMLSRESEHAYPIFPLLNGFCTLISRKVFNECGLLDEDSFPIGYGEETDLCLRAAKAGFLLVVADDCFVYHHKSMTFGKAGRKELSKAGTAEVLNKHVGIIIPELENQMQGNSVLARLREKVSELRSVIGKS